MKKILTPVDFSEDSINALEHAINIAHKMQAGIHLVHVLPQKKLFSLFSNSREEYTRSEVEENLDRLIRRLSSEHNVQLEYTVMEGKVYEQVVNCADEIEPEMIIMGTHGRSGMEELWMGSNAYRVVSHSPCPVLTLRKNWNASGFPRIVLPIDNSPETRQKVPFTVEFAQHFNSEVHVVGVISDDADGVIRRINNYVHQVKKYVEEYGLKTVDSTRQGSNITDMAIDYAKEVEASAIAVMTEQEIDAANIILGPYAQQMVHHSPIPVLSVRPRSDIHLSLYSG